MLGRVANGIFWLYRYLERAENTARLLAAGHRMALTRGTDEASQEWKSVLTTLGQLHATIEREGLASPSVIVVGDVVRGVASVSQPAPGQANATRRTG